MRGRRSIYAVAKERVAARRMRQGDGCGVSRDAVRTCMFVNEWEELVEYRGWIPASAREDSEKQGLGGVL